MKIAVIGSGIAGLGAAWALDGHHEVTLFEAEGRLGGHTNTVTTPDGIAVDTGFIVYNEATYPNLTAFFSHLGVATQDSDMSFGCSIEDGRLEYCGDNLLTLFAQKRNLLSPRFHQMWRDILRFYREAPAGIARLEPQESLGELLRAGGYSTAFIEDHLLPMGAAIWSTPAEQMLDFPALSFLRFFDNHGLLRVQDRIPWRTVTGGARSYIERIMAGFRGEVRTGTPVVKVTRESDGVTVRDNQGHEARFDQVILAAHADQSRRLMGEPSAEEAEILGSFAYAPNTAILHTDPALMPKRRRAWASWNYMTGAGGPREHVSVTYWMNRLQGLPAETQLFVSLNPHLEPDPARTLARFVYDHPMFDAAAIRAQRALPSIQGVGGIWYCGSWCGFGFHEDALASGLAVAEALGCARPWQVTEVSPAFAHATPERPVDGPRAAAA